MKVGQNNGIGWRQDRIELEYDGGMIEWRQDRMEVGQDGGRL